MILIKNGYVHRHMGSFEKADIILDKNKIVEVGTICNSSGFDIIDAHEHYVIPGLIDIHTHGCNGCCVMNPYFDAMEGMSEYFKTKGVTGFLPTIFTSEISDINKALTNIKSAINIGTSGSKILGINVEGPFINKKYKGVQDESKIVKPSKRIINEFIETSGNNIKLITLAPEIFDENFGYKEIIELQHKGITFSIGHSDINYKGAIEAFNNGFKHITHLFNAMRGIHHREPGLVGAALEDNDVSVELITDGFHINAAILKLVVKSKPYGKVVLISDSIKGAGLKDGVYLFGDERVFVNNGKCTTSDGVLAGSTLSMIDAVVHMVKEAGISLAEAVDMASYNPAEVIGMAKNKGSIEEGKDGDIVILDKELRVVTTIVEGKVVFIR